MTETKVDRETLVHLIRVLELIASGYKADGSHDRYIIVNNPNFRENEGNEYNLVLDVAEVRDMLVPPSMVVLRDRNGTPIGAPERPFVVGTDRNAAGGGRCASMQEWEE